MENVALYPFDKITRGLIKFRNLLNYNILSVIDFCFYNGKDTGEIIEGKVNDIKITNEISKGLKNVNILIINDPGTPFPDYQHIKLYNENNLIDRWKELIITAHKNNIKIISTNIIENAAINEWLKENNIEIEQYKLTREDIHNKIKEFGNKMIDGVKTKTISIFATQRCLGKFTAQLELYNHLKNNNKKVKSIITEPTAFIFNQFILANCRISYIETFLYIQAIINECSKKGIEYLIYADQGGISYTDDVSWCLSKISSLKGLMPDLIFLVVGYNDDYEIEKALSIFKLYTGREIDALLLPDQVELSPGNYIKITADEFEKRKNNLIKKFNITNIEYVADIGKLWDSLNLKQNRE